MSKYGSIVPEDISSNEFDFHRASIEITSDILYRPSYEPYMFFLEIDNFPTTEVKKQGVDKTITVNFKADDIDENSNIMDIVMRTIDIMGNKISEENISNSDMVLTIQTDKTGLLETEKLDECYKYGYRQTIEQIDKIKEIIKG